MSRISYLKVRLDDSAVASLADMSASLASAAEGIDAGTPMAAGFSPMDTGQLHMTFFFAGEYLSRLSADELQDWHRDVRACVGETKGDAAPDAADAADADDAAGAADADDVDDADAAPDAECATVSLRYAGMALFPPGKLNLVVALFDAPPTLHATHARVADVCTGHGVERSGSARRQLAETAAERNNARWRPHVTLGKIRASKSDVGQVGQMMIDRVEAGGEGGGNGGVSRVASCARSTCARSTDDGKDSAESVEGETKARGGDRRGKDDGAQPRTSLPGDRLAMIKLCRVDGSGDVEACRDLIARGIKVDMQDDCFFTALHQAALNGRDQIVRVLVQAGAATETKCKYHRRTALEWARERGHAAVVSILEAGPTGGGGSDGGRGAVGGGVGGGGVGGGGGGEGLDEIRIHGITMGGFVPKQQWLDWDFNFDCIFDP